MDREHTLLIQWAKLLVIGFLVFIALMVGSCQMTKYRIVEAIKAGADPLTASCALGAVESYCILKYAEHGR